MHKAANCNFQARAQAIANIKIVRTITSLIFNHTSVFVLCVTALTYHRRPVPILYLNINQKELIFVEQKVNFISSDQMLVTIFVHQTSIKEPILSPTNCMIVVRESTIYQLVENFTLFKVISIVVLPT